MTERKLRRLLPNEEEFIPIPLALEYAPDTRKQTLLKKTQDFVATTVLSLPIGESVFFTFDVQDAGLHPQEMIGNAILATNPQKYITYTYVYEDYVIQPLLNEARKPSGSILVRRKEPLE